MAGIAIAFVRPESRYKRQIEGAEGLTHPIRKGGVLIRDDETGDLFFLPVGSLPEGFHIQDLPNITPARFRREYEKVGAREVATGVEKARRGTKYRYVSWNPEPGADNSIRLTYKINRQGQMINLGESVQVEPGVGPVKIRKKS